MTNSRIGNYVLSQILGEGNFGQVKRGEDEKGNLYAVKIVKRVDNNQASERKLQALRNEAEIMGQLNNDQCRDRIVQFVNFYGNEVEIFDDGSQIPVACLVMELLEEGELFDIVKAGGAIREDIARFYIR